MSQGKEFPEKINLPNNLLPEAHGFVQFVAENSDKSIIQNSSYGHDLGNLAENLKFRARQGNSFEQQKQVIREKVKKLVKSYGPNIIKVMKDEFRLVLTQEDLAEILSDPVETKKNEQF